VANGATPLRGFASKVQKCSWTGSVPSAVAGGVKTVEPQNPREYRTLNIDPPATAGGTDPVQVQVVTFEAKPHYERLLRSK
jgi:hypothetical protein